MAKEEGGVFSPASPLHPGRRVSPPPNPPPRLLYLNRQLDPHGQNNLVGFVFGIFYRTPRDGPSTLRPPSRTGILPLCLYRPIIEILGVPIGSESLEPGTPG